MNSREFRFFIEAADSRTESEGLGTVQHFIATSFHDAISETCTTGRYFGFTALMLASSKGHLNMVNALLTAGAKTGRKHSNNGNTALHYAVYNKQEDVIAALLKKMSFEEIIIENAAHRNALQEAEGRNYNKIIKLINTRINDLLNSDETLPLSAIIAKEKSLSHQVAEVSQASAASSSSSSSSNDEAKEVPNTNRRQQDAAKRVAFFNRSLQARSAGNSTSSASSAGPAALSRQS
jgi:ankyrin repeat protein